jgi:hypothetical protein
MYKLKYIKIYIHFDFISPTPKERFKLQKFNYGDL